MSSFTSPSQWSPVAFPSCSQFAQLLSLPHGELQACRQGMFLGKLAQLFHPANAQTGEIPKTAFKLHCVFLDLLA